MPLLLVGASALLLAMASPMAAATQGSGGNPNRELLVLAFHEIDDPAQAVMPGYAISPQAFEAQLTWLQAQGFHLV
ncbi:MAG: poly-beta-1,6-N-acetyl-D-glucosamine N-deacetylase PgaB, partial [Synechococcaceae bacterium WB9_2_170]|nr:poly-beta-1,6-N-acetyl-D-glucosamine N-deacetylase PgaB [Synechococcaceae bacterium WB9_2_170]